MTEPYDAPGPQTPSRAEPEQGWEPVTELAGSGPAGHGPEPLGVAVAMTGNAEVDAAVERLGDADGLPTGGHIEVYEDVHQGLRDALASLDENRG
jgi:hypothetical protein